jgi:hypothetical protein
MGKDYSSEELAARTFYISMAGIGLFIATVFLFIL